MDNDNKTKVNFYEMNDEAGIVRPSSSASNGNSYEQPKQQHTQTQ